jgi:hypothetical protein
MSALTNGSPQSFDNIPLITEDDLDALFGQVRFVNVKELARFLGLSPKTIYNHIKRGTSKCCASDGISASRARPSGAS